MLLAPDLYVKRADVIRSYKYLTLNKNGLDVRLDRIDLKIEDNKKIIERMTHFGNYYGNFIDIDEFIFSKININDGSIESSESSIVNGISGMYGCNSVSFPRNFIGIDGETENFPFINKAIYKMDSLNTYITRIATISNNTSLPNIAMDFEDRMNIEFSGLIGILASILTQSSLSIPFRANIIIDSKEGINIRDVKLIFNDSDIKDVFKSELKSFYDSLNIINRILKDKYIKEDRQIRIYAAIREFDSFITIQDLEFDIKYEFHLNNTDHTRSIYTTISHLGSKWYDKNEFGDLLETKCKMVIPAMFEMQNENRRFTFENVDYVDNFPLSYY